MLGCFGKGLTCSGYREGTLRLSVLSKISQIARFTDNDL